MFKYEKVFIQMQGAIYLWMVDLVFAEFIKTNSLSLCFFAASKAPEAPWGKYEEKMKLSAAVPTVLDFV